MIRNRKGYTIIEMLMTSAIIIFVITGSLGIYIMMQRFWKGGSVQATLQGKARLALEHISRNARDAYQAQILPSGSSTGYGVILTLDPNQTYTDATDDINCEYILQGTDLIYMPDITVANQKVLLENISLFSGETVFELNGRTITVNLRSVDPDSLNGYQMADFSTSVLMRNE